MTDKTTVPVVMVFSGNDPSGGAGLQADIESISSMGCHTAPVLTAITVQDTQTVKRFTAVESHLVLEQARTVFEDMPVTVIKIGMLASVENAEAIHTLLLDYPDVPVILDPIIASGNGTELANSEIISIMSEFLLPLTTIVTPNSREACVLGSRGDSLDACAQDILETGCEYVLITGTHENTPEVVNTLYSDCRTIEKFTWERLPASFHGSGCTLAATIAGLIAQGLEPLASIREAQEYTWESLRNGYRIGMGQYLPNRFFWANSTEECELKEIETEQ